MHRLGHGVFWSLVGLAAIGSPALGADDAPPKKEIGTFSFQLENDLFSGTDRHYTNGIRLSWLSPDGDTVESLELVRETLETFALDATGRQKEDNQVRFGLSLGQDLYTPEDRASRTLIVEDRPYAAWLYGAASLHTISMENQNPITL